MKRHNQICASPFNEHYIDFLLEVEHFLALALCYKTIIYLMIYQTFIFRFLIYVEWSRVIGCNNFNSSCYLLCKSVQMNKRRENPLIIWDVFVVDKITLKLSSMIYNSSLRVLLLFHIVIVVLNFVQSRERKRSVWQIFVRSDEYVIQWLLIKSSIVYIHIFKVSTRFCNKNILFQ